ncbi:MAG: hypothetical protein KBH07_04565 [Flavobacteriales bacterium]|nr:hypothetical protein [Flavobacteriales bacterium]
MTKLFANKEAAYSEAETANNQNKRRCLDQASSKAIGTSALIMKCEQ